MGLLTYVSMPNLIKLFTNDFTKSQVQRHAEKCNHDISEGSGWTPTCCASFK